LAHVPRVRQDVLRSRDFSPLAGIHLIGTKAVVTSIGETGVVDNFSPLAGIHLIGTRFADADGLVDVC
jgi:hypothetical protein